MRDEKNENGIDRYKLMENIYFCFCVFGFGF